MYAPRSLLTFLCPEKQCCKIYFHKFRQIKICHVALRQIHLQVNWCITCHDFISLSVFRLLPFRQFLLYVLQTAGTDKNKETTHNERGSLGTGLSGHLFQERLLKKVSQAKAAWRKSRQPCLSFHLVQSWSQPAIKTSPKAATYVLALKRI